MKTLDLEQPIATVPTIRPNIRTRAGVGVRGARADYAGRRRHQPRWPNQLRRVLTDDAASLTELKEGLFRLFEGAGLRASALGMLPAREVLLAFLRRNILAVQ